MLKLEAVSSGWLVDAYLGLIYELLIKKLKKL